MLAFYFSRFLLHYLLKVNDSGVPVESFQKDQIALVVHYRTARNHQFHNEFLVLLIYQYHLVKFLDSHLFIIFSLHHRCLLHHLIYVQILQ